MYQHCSDPLSIKQRRKSVDRFPKSVFWTSKQLFTIHFLLATCNVCPLAIPEFFAHIMGIWLLPNHSSLRYVNTLWADLVTWRSDFHSLYISGYGVFIDQRVSNNMINCAIDLLLLHSFACVWSCSSHNTTLHAGGRRSCISCRYLAIFGGLDLQCEVFRFGVRFLFSIIWLVTTVAREMWMWNTYKLIPKGNCNIHLVGLLTGSWNIYVFRVMVTCIFSGLRFQFGATLWSSEQRKFSCFAYLHISYHLASLQLKIPLRRTLFFERRLLIIHTWASPSFMHVLRFICF